METLTDEKLKLAFENAVETAAASRMIRSAEDPTFIDMFGDTQKVPSWDEVKPSPDELEGIARLHEPLGIISIPGISFSVKSGIARTLHLKDSIGPLRYDWPKGQALESFTVKDDGFGKPFKISYKKVSIDLVLLSKIQQDAIAGFRQAMEPILYPNKACDKLSIEYCGEWDDISNPGSTKIGEDFVFSWKPETPGQGLTKEARLCEGEHTAPGVDVIFIDGTDDAPPISRFGAPKKEVEMVDGKVNAFSFRTMCEIEGFIMPDMDAYLALQLEGRRRERYFDMLDIPMGARMSRLREMRVACFLDNYVVTPPEQWGGIVGAGYVGKAVAFSTTDARDHYIQAGRCAVRLKKKR